MSIKQPEWTKLLVGPNVQEDGNDKGRQPNLNFGTGLSVSTDPINKRNTVTIDEAVNPTPNWLNVKHFGAVGDKVNNDTSAIAAAIASASLVQAPVRTVFFPSGTYRITGQLAILSNVSDVLLLGEPGTTIYSEFITNNILTIQGTRNGVRGIRMVASGSPGAGSHFRLTGNDTFIEDCVVDNSWNGIFASTGTRQKLRRNVVNDARNSGMIVGTTGFPSTKTTVEGNQVLFASGNCLAFSDCRDVVAVGNMLFSGSDCVSLVGASHRVIFSRNLVGGATDDGITVLGSNCIITDNIIENCVGDAIDLRGEATGSIIKNNRYQNNLRDYVNINYTLAPFTGVLGLPGDIDHVFAVDTEGAAATDDLDSILFGRAGQKATFSIANNGRIVTFKNATGNLRLQGDWTPDNTNSRLELEYLALDGIWRELSRNNLAVGGGGGGSGGADAGVSYVTMGATGSLPNERVLTAGTGLTRTDGGAGSTVTMAIDNNVVAMVSGTRFTGGVTGSAGLAFNQQASPPVSASANTVSIHGLSGSMGRVPYAVNDQGRGSVLAPFPTHRVNGTATPGAGLITAMTIPLNDNSFSMLGARVLMSTPGTATALVLEAEMRVTRSLGGNAFKLASPSEFRFSNSSSLYCAVDVSGNNAIIQLSASHANTNYVAEGWFHTQNLP